MARLADLIRPCGPIFDESSARRSWDQLTRAAAENGGTNALTAAREALLPMFSAAPYLSFLARDRFAGLRETLEAPPSQRLIELVSLAHVPLEQSDTLEIARALRRLKKDAHLFVAICDLGGLWSVPEVMNALTDLADAILASAFEHACRTVLRRVGRAGFRSAAGADAGIFCVAMGKHGARELNYSSDVDVCVFYDAEITCQLTDLAAESVVRDIADLFTRIVHERTSDGYVFRVDHRLRPDPSCSPLALPMRRALSYYEGRGQNWERAAYIKARPLAGDMQAAKRFLAALQPFVWRRNLDFSSIADIHSIKRQIKIHRADNPVESAGADLKLGPGGIREIEFFVQTQQLIFGGRDKSLRRSATTAALSSLAAAGGIAPTVARDLTAHYERLRKWEHRLQMIADEQTHRLPSDPVARSRVACMSGYSSLDEFDRQVELTLGYVHRCFGELFAGEEDLSSEYGSLVFTGADDDPGTLSTLRGMGFHDPSGVSRGIRIWRGGGVPATSSVGAREALARLTPRLLEAARRTGEPDAAFAGFDRFFSKVAAGSQVLALLLAKPQALQLLVDIMALAPRLARVLARQPAALEALVGGAVELNELIAGDRASQGHEGLEQAMDRARILHREASFHIAAQVIRGGPAAEVAAAAFSDLADGIVRAMGEAAWAATRRSAGEAFGDAAVIALGKTGSREMRATSDLDLVIIYTDDSSATAPPNKGFAQDKYFSRFAQRLITALSAPTNEGELYQVDMRLRPSGKAGPVAVKLDSFEHYYMHDAETWEFLALTRARVVWASSLGFAQRAATAIDRAIRQPRDLAALANDILKMREILQKEHPPSSFWDAKYVAGGLVDIEFVSQFLQLSYASRGGPLPRNTYQTLMSFSTLVPDASARLGRLSRAWRLQERLDQLLTVALEDGADPEQAPSGLLSLLAQRENAASADDLRQRLARIRGGARADFLASFVV